MSFAVAMSFQYKYSYNDDGGNTSSPVHGLAALQGSPASFASTAQVDQSLASAMSMQTTQSGSKAVLSALRALQDKIRRLENEKSDANQIVERLENQVREQEIASSQMEHKLKLECEQLQLELATRTDALINEKVVLEERLNRAQSEGENWRVKYIQSEDEKTELKSLSGEYENVVNSYRLKEKDLSRWLMLEAQRHEQEMDSMREHVEHHGSQYSAAYTDMQSARAREVEIRKLASHLLSLNGSLIKRLTGVTRTIRHIPSKPRVASSGYNTNLKKSGKKLSKKPSKQSSGISELKQRLTEWPEDSKIHQALQEVATKPNSLRHIHRLYLALAAHYDITESIEKKKIASKPGGGKSKKLTRVKAAKLAAAAARGTTAHSQSAPSSKEPKIQSSAMPIRIPTVYSKSPSSPGHMEHVIHSLEGELSELSDDYRKLLSSHASVIPSGPEDTIEKANELATALRKLQEKREQVMVLKGQ